jgi:translation initiation factor IF-2
MLAGKHHGKIKAMHDERGNIYCSGPSTPYRWVLMVLQLQEISFNVLKTKKEANCV